MKDVITLDIRHEHQEGRPPGGDDKFMVVIMRNADLVGIPVRDVTEAKAREMLQPLTFAVEYGVKLATKIATDALQAAYVERQK